MTERALLFTDVVETTRLVERLGDARAADVWSAHAVGAGSDSEVGRKIVARRETLS